MLKKFLKYEPNTIFTDKNVLHELKFKSVLTSKHKNLTKNTNKKMGGMPKNNPQKPK